MKYSCEICGRKHDVFFGIKVPLNNDIRNLLDTKSNRIKEYRGIYLLDKKQVIHPVELKIETDYGESFSYQTWVSFDVERFFKMTELVAEKDLIKLEGVLIDDLIPIYPNSKGIKIIASFKPMSPLHEKVTIEVIDESEIRKDQINGISKSRMIELMNKIHHNKN